MSEERDTGEYRKKGLGWRPYWDEGDQDCLEISHLQRELASVAVPAEKVWQIGPILDQGHEGACVSFAGFLSCLVSQGYVSACAAAQIPRR